MSVVERWMGHRAVQGVVGGLLVGREGAVGVGRGRDADQRLQRHGVAQRATGGEDWVLEWTRTTKNTVVVQLAIISGRIRVNYHTLAVIIPVV